jgi:hypothetical protein
MVWTCLLRESEPVAWNGQVIVSLLPQSAGPPVDGLDVLLVDVDVDELVVVAWLDVVLVDVDVEEPVEVPPLLVLVLVTPPDAVLVELVEVEVLTVDDEPDEVLVDEVVVVVVPPAAKAHDHGNGWQAPASWPSG